MAEIAGERVVLRPVRPSDADELARILATPEVFAWWGAQGAEFPFDVDPETTRLAIERDGRVVGLIDLTEEPEPDFRHASLDLFVDPAEHRRGVASDAIGAALRHLVEERGHHRVTIDPALDNEAAVRCYERAGFRRVGVLRAYWRDPAGRWRDGLLLEYVVEPRPV